MYALLFRRRRLSASSTIWAILAALPLVSAFTATGRAAGLSGTAEVQLPQGAIDKAVSLLGAGAVPPNVTIKAVDRPLEDFLGRTVQGANGHFFIYLNVPVLQDSFPSLIHDLNGAYAGGALCGTIAHELAHVAAGGETNDCRDSDFSCDHLAIDSGAHSRVCSIAAECKAAYDNPSTPPSELVEIMLKIIGLCESAGEIEDKWKDHSGWAYDCYTSAPDCPFSGVAPGSQLPPAPPQTGFPGGVVFEKCPACAALGL